MEEDNERISEEGMGLERNNSYSDDNNSGCDPIKISSRINKRGIIFGKIVNEESFKSHIVSTVSIKIQISTFASKKRLYAHSVQYDPCSTYSTIC